MLVLWNRGGGFAKLVGYIVTDNGLMYIGQEHFANTDADGYPLVSMDGIWSIQEPTATSSESLQVNV